MTEERMTPALEACPKGHAPRWHISEHPTIGAEYGLACDCDKTVGLYPTEAEAIAAWNTRASPAPEPVAAMEPVAWRPIETAPKDGTWVQLWGPSGYQGCGRCWRNIDFEDATHWIPLPPPPGSEPPATDPLMDEVREALADMIAQTSRTYRARNGRDCYIEDENGEMCMIVPHDAWHRLEALAAKLGAKP